MKLPVFSMVIQGTVDIEFLTLGMPITTTLDEGEELTFDPLTLEITAPPANPGIVIVEVDGEQITIAPGQTVQVEVPPVLIGGTIIPIDRTALLLYHVQGTVVWVIPIIVAVVGIGLVFLRRK